MDLKAEEILKINVQCNEAYEVKNDGAGYLNVIPIVSGNFTGKINGTVVNGGADWNTRRLNGNSHVFAKYLLQADNGEYIAIENEGKIGSNDWSNRIKTVPRFQVSEESEFAWLNSGVYVGELVGGEVKNQVEITIYRLL